MRRICCTILYSHIIVEYNGWNHDFMLQTHKFSFEFLEFTSLIMGITKEFLYFCHNLKTKIIYPEVNSHKRIGIRKLYSWKDEAELGTNFTSQTPLDNEPLCSLFISYSTVQEEGNAINYHSNFYCPTFLGLSR